MRWLARIFVFTTTFVLGVALSPSSGLQNCNFPVTEPVRPLELAPKPNSIRVMYSGWSNGGRDLDPFLKFVIYNGLDRTVAYSSVTPEFPHAQLGVNGKPYAWESICGFGQSEYYISPGASAEVYVPLSRFRGAIKNEDRVTVTFYLTSGPSHEHLPSTSEPFLLPDDFRQAIKSTRASLR